MVIFLTGASGFIGKNFLKLALSKGHYVYAISRKKNQKKQKNLKWLKGEIDDDWSKYFKKTDVLVHLAAIGLKKIPNDQSYKVLELNVKKSYYMIVRAIKSGCKNFVIGSTSSEYKNNGLCNKKKLNRNSERGFSSIYSLSKIVFSDLIKYLSSKKKGKFRIMRIFPTYGSGEVITRLYPRLKSYAKQGKDLKITSPYEMRDFTKVDYVSKVLLEACIFYNSKAFEIFHISSNKPKRVIDFSKFYWKKFKAKGKILFNTNSKKICRHISNINSTWKLKNEK
tara:strand:+ start:16225 stop:17067 length:843 start_codon:yes stop_codon:yes gene_type:complete